MKQEQQQQQGHHTAKSRAPEFYGFVALCSTSILYVLYILWALLPDEYIVWTGIEWYPSREWSLLIPSYSMVLVLLSYFTYMALTIYGTPAFEERRSIVDSRTQYPPSFQNKIENGKYDKRALFASYSPYAGEWQGGQSSLGGADSELYDIPIELLNKVVYS